MGVSSSAFLIAITRRQQVAQVRGKPIYAITDVALIPLSSQEDANVAISQAKATAQKRAANSKKQRVDADVLMEDDVSSDEDGHSTVPEEDMHDHDLALSTQDDKNMHRRSTSVAEDVIGRRGVYGRFAQKWFSKRGWSEEKRRSQGMRTDGSDELAMTDWTDPAKESVDASQDNLVPSNGSNIDNVSQEDTLECGATKEPGEAVIAQPTEAAKESVTMSLLPKLIRTTKLLLGSSRSFYFSYDLDITRSIGTQQQNLSGLPLHRLVDPLVGYFALFLCTLRRV
jgi:SacI homology domain